MEEFKPVIIETSTEKEVEKLHLFSIVEDGVEEKHYIPRKVGYNLTLGTLQVLATAGDVAANIFALTEVLGEDGYNALLDCDDLTDEQFEQISDIVATVVLGKNKGKLNRASRRALMRSRG